MENLHKKVIGNAMSAYFMVIVCIFFLFSKQHYLNHPFVKNHVKAAFSLQVLLLIMLFIMSYPFLENIRIFEYSINTILTALFSLGIFGAMLYGIYRAHLGKTTSLGEIFHTAGLSREVVKNTTTEKLKEEENLLLILASIPFIGYIIYPRHKDIAHIRDVSQLNLIITTLSTLIFISGYGSLASIIILLYIIWSVFQGLQLVFQSTITTIDFSKLPTVEEKYNIQKALLRYLKNSLKKDMFTPLREIIEMKTQQRRKIEVSDIEILKTLKKCPIPSWLFYIPFINLIGIFFTKTYDRFHIKNGITISILFAILIAVLHWDNPALILILFPIFYGIGYIDRKAYRMPYIYDIYHFLASIILGVGSIFHKTRELQKTTKTSSIKMNETKKES